MNTEWCQRRSHPRFAVVSQVAPTVEATPKVVNLMEALKKSLNAVSEGKKKTAQVEAKRPAAKRKRA